MIRQRWLTVVGALALGGPLWSSRAGAQTTQINANTITSTSGNITVDIRNTERTVFDRRGDDRYREYNSRQWWISYEDCRQDDIFSFPISLRDTSNRLEVWAGTSDCAALRGNSDRQQCWIVAAEDRPEDRFTIAVPARNVVNRDLNSDTVPSGLGPEVCDESTDPNGEQISFFFMLVEGGTNVDSARWTGGEQGTGFDMVGPEPPGRIRVGIGESQLSIELDNVNEESDRDSFEAFCVPALTVDDVPGDAGAVPTDAGADGGLDAGVTLVDGGAPAACYTPLLRVGARPPIEYRCGSVNETSRTLNTNRLENGQLYAVGVSGSDILRNAGPLSEIQCVTPKLLTDFFEMYRDAGGQGGGGFCSVPRVPLRSTSLPGLVLGLAMAALGVRRARSPR